jgi:hypothetical protein
MEALELRGGPKLEASAPITILKEALEEQALETESQRSAFLRCEGIGAERLKQARLEHGGLS